MKILDTFSKLSIVLVILTVSMTIKVFEPQFLTTLQLKWFDVYQNAKPRVYEDLPVKIIDIDDASLEKIGQWPWPRTQVAELVKSLGEAGAAAIAFDMVFAEPDRTSPKHMQRLWQLKDTSALSRLPDHDDVFAKEIAKWPVVMGGILNFAPGKHVEPKAGFAFAGGSPIPQINNFNGIISNLDKLDAAAQGHGMFNSDPDADGILRRLPLVFRIGNTVYPSLSVEALRVAQGAGSVVVKSVGAEDAEFADAITAMKVGGIEVPTDANGKLWMYYDQHRQSRYIPAWRAMAGLLDEGELAGKIVLVGTSAPGLKDLRSTPLNSSIPGVEVHAQALEQMMQEITLLKPAWARGLEVMLMVVAGLLALWVSTRFIAIVSAFGFLAVLSGVFLASWFAFDQYHFLLEPIVSWITVILVYFLTMVWRFAKTEQDKSKIRSTFSLYVSEDLVNEMAKNPDMVKLGGEKKDITILFCDIRNFSAISERLDPEALTRLINGYLTPMTDIILSHGGTIDKYMGDAIMAIWNAPLNVDGHPTKALQASLAMRSKLQALNKKWAEDPAIASNIALPIRFGIGVNSGECSVGNMGSNQRFEYSVLGHEVDLASRLEGMTKHYGVDIIASERTNIRVDDVATMLLDVIRVKGKEESIHIYAVLADASLNENEVFKELVISHQQMLAAYKRKHWRDVEAYLSDCRMWASHVPLFQLGALYNLYEQRVQEFRDEPPGDNWDGVFTANFK